MGNENILKPLYLSEWEIQLEHVHYSKHQKILDMFRQKHLIISIVDNMLKNQWNDKIGGGVFNYSFISLGKK